MRMAVSQKGRQRRADTKSAKICAFVTLRLTTRSRVRNAAVIKPEALFSFADDHTIEQPDPWSKSQSIPRSGLTALLRVRRLAILQEEFVEVINGASSTEASFNRSRRCHRDCFISAETYAITR